MDALIITEVIRDTDRIMAVIQGMGHITVAIQALSRSGFPIVLTTSMALGIGTDRLITLGRQATGDGVITTDIGTTVTTTDGTKVRNVS